MRIARAVLPVFAVVWLGAFPSPCPIAAPADADGGVADTPSYPGEQQHHPRRQHHPQQHNDGAIDHAVAQISHSHGHAHHHHERPDQALHDHDDGDCPHGAVQEHQECPHCGAPRTRDSRSDGDHDDCLIFADMASQGGGYAVTVKWDHDPGVPLLSAADSTLHFDGRAPPPHALAREAVRAPSLRLHLRHCVLLN